jgi:N-methylhydantoinase B
VLCDGVSLGNMTDRQRFPPGGLFGGDAGVKGETLVNPGTPQESPLGAKELRTLRRGDVVSSRLAGGGGYGPAIERDPERVRRDVAEGYVSVTAAADRYGVVLSPATGAVDELATRELRARLGGHDDD